MINRSCAAGSVVGFIDEEILHTLQYWFKIRYVVNQVRKYTLCTPSYDWSCGFPQVLLMLPLLADANYLAKEKEILTVNYSRNSSVSTSLYINCI